jgi:FkbM family methyltransferase
MRVRAAHPIMGFSFFSRPAFFATPRPPPKPPKRLLATNFSQSAMVHPKDTQAGAILRLVKKTLIAVAGVLLLVAGGVALLRTNYPLESDAAWQSLSGRSPHCSLKVAWETPGHAASQEKIKDDYIALLKAGPSDGQFERWDLDAETALPPRQFWIPVGNRWILPFNLSEQARDIYKTEGPWGIRQGDVVLDCGAHVGVFSHRALARGAGKVVAIEPSPRNAECLRRNFAKEIEEGRLVVYAKGVWDREDTLILRQLDGNSAADTVVMDQPGAHEGESVPLTTIDTLVKELGLERVDYIKMDIEGAEVPALHGAKETLAKWKPRLALAAYHKADDPETLPAAVREAYAGYQSQCSSCIMDSAGLRPEVLLFKAD